MFGADLSEECARTHTEAPLVVMKCVEEIERACSSHGKCKKYHFSLHGPESIYMLLS